MVTMLLQRGVDVNAHDEDGQSPLLLAVRGRYQGPGCCSGHEEVDGGLFLWGNLEGLHGGGGLRRCWQCLGKENNTDSVRSSW